ncbi:MAG: hypothetical protein PVJ55_11915, partial [Anaerolineae bacterium]
WTTDRSAGLNRGADKSPAWSCDWPEGRAACSFDRTRSLARMGETIVAARRATEQSASSGRQSVAIDASGWQDHGM